MRLSHRCFTFTAFTVVFAVSAPAFGAAPRVRRFLPTSGPADTKVVIRGLRFKDATAVEFNGAAAAFIVNSNLMITATVPITASTGRISVTTRGGTRASNANFTVTPSIALSQIDGPPTTTVEVSAAGFDPSSAVDLYLDAVDTKLVSTNATGNFSRFPVQIPSSTQPGTHWFTLVERSTTSRSAQASFDVLTNWPMSGFGPSGRNFNPFENTLFSHNVGDLVNSWTSPSGSAASPFVVFKHNVYVGNAKGRVNAYSPAGNRLWTASTGTDFEFVTPAAGDGLVFFGGSNGKVYAFPYLCHTDGSACTPQWITDIGSQVTGSPTLFRNTLYVGAQDGQIHPLNPVTGVAGSPFFAFDADHGGVSTPVAFAPDGSLFYVTGGINLQGQFSSGLSFLSELSAVASPIAVYNGAFYFTTTDATVYEVGGNGWSADTEGTGCAPAPAIANNIVYAAGCSGIKAYAADNGAHKWSVTTLWPVLSLAAANRVLYACVCQVPFCPAETGGTLVAYDATNGKQLWGGGGCNGQAIEADGIVYGAFGNVSAYSLVPAEPNSAQRPDTQKPNPLKLAPDLGLVASPAL